jgi:hypothetical protein
MIPDAIAILLKVIMVDLLGSILPNADETIMLNIGNSLGFLVAKFVILANYYLPVSVMITCITMFVSVWIVIFGIKVTTRLVEVFSVGALKPDRLIKLKN